MVQACPRTNLIRCQNDSIPWKWSWSIVEAVRRIPLSENFDATSFAAAQALGKNFARKMWLFSRGVFLWRLGDSLPIPGCIAAAASASAIGPLFRIGIQFWDPLQSRKSRMPLKKAWMRWVCWCLSDNQFIFSVTDYAGENRFVVLVARPKRVRW